MALATQKLPKRPPADHQVGSQRALGDVLEIEHDSIDEREVVATAGLPSAGQARANTENGFQSLILAKVFS